MPALARRHIAIDGAGKFNAADTAAPIVAFDRFVIKTEIYITLSRRVRLLERIAKNKMSLDLGNRDLGEHKSGRNKFV
jgi:hypothetical protein